MKTRPLLTAALLLGLPLAASIPSGPAWSGTPAAASAGSPRDRVDFTLPDLEGNPVSLGRFLGRKPVLLVFWATWCPHCNEVVPEINRIHEDFGRGDRLQILALDYKESPEKVEAFLRKKQVRYPVLLDRNGTVARGYRVLGIPTYILIDVAGRIVYRGHELPGISRILDPSPIR
ncbi:MAG TPA: redoxin [Deltaproteobacteria bacterium]|nr:redoxin [Deltaproteobacteria bacterium]